MDSDFGIPLSPLQQLPSQFHAKLPPCLQVKKGFDSIGSKKLFDPEMDQTLSSISFKKFSSENEFKEDSNTERKIAVLKSLAEKSLEHEEKVPPDVFDILRVPDSPVEGIRKLMVAILATQFKWILSQGVKRYPWLGKTVLWTASNTQHCKARILSAVGMEASVLKKLSVEEASNKVAELGAAVTVSVAGYYALKLEVSKLIEREKKGDETEQPLSAEMSMLLLKAVETSFKTKLLKIHTEEAKTPPTPPPPPPRLLPTWLNKVKGVGDSRLHREEERMLKYHRSLFRKW